MGIDIDTITKNEIEIIFKLHVTCIVQIKHVIGWLNTYLKKAKKTIISNNILNLFYN